jgi:hypothetical protein
LDSFHHLKGVEFAFRNTVAAGSTLVGFFHHDVFSVFIYNYLQHAAGASFNATLATRAIFLHHVDYPVFRTLISVQSAENPKQKHACQNDIQCIHFLKFYDCKITAGRFDGQWIKAGKSWTICGNFS